MIGSSSSGSLRPVAALGWGGGSGIEDVAGLFARVEAFLYTVADAAVVAAAEGGGAKEAAAAGDWLSGITGSMETVLKVRPPASPPLAPPRLLSACHLSPHSYRVCVQGARVRMCGRQLRAVCARAILSCLVRPCCYFATILGNDGNLRGCIPDAGWGRFAGQFQFGGCYKGALECNTPCTPWATVE